MLRVSQVLVVDPFATLSADAIARLRTPQTALHHVTDAAVAGRMATEAGIDLVVLIVPEQGEPDAVSEASIAGWLRRRPQRPLLVTAGPALAQDLARSLVLGRARERTEAGASRTRAPSEWTPGLAAIVGAAPATQRLHRMIERVAPSERAVLVHGPTGCGKELVVQALHQLGLHPDAPLVDVNCGAIPESLMESLLFGHVRGAFTGADAAQEGYLTAVGHGTLFLDEVAELPMLLQAKLLRVLESRRFRRVGSTQEHTFHGRVIAATHADLRRACAERRFREDLYYRLAVLGIEVPSLAERRDDIALLVAHFAAAQRRPLRFTAAAMAELAGRPWPGNIRQLRNAIDRLAVTCDADPIDAADLVEHLDGGSHDEGTGAAVRTPELGSALLRIDGHDKLAAAETLLIDAAMREYGGNKSAAARALGVHRKVLERRLVRDTPHAVALDDDDEVVLESD
ncbi:MAG: sigma-54-dependent Fis family transcriptional regulator [Deltaproteobacteria bacterium]|nr:sigma-54-dependent Fis family transcriptional regulator [Deltaproteobacteria bacterium]